MRIILFFSCALLLLNASRSMADDSPVEMAASDQTFMFTPAKVSAHVGQAMRLRLSSSDGVHGVASAELGIGTTLIRPSHPVTVTFTPQKAGSYTVHCAFGCGTGHGGMAFVVDVTS